MPFYAIYNDAGQEQQVMTLTENQVVEIEAQLPEGWCIDLLPETDIDNA